MSLLFVSSFKFALALIYKLIVNILDVLDDLPLLLIR